MIDHVICSAVVNNDTAIIRNSLSNELNVTSTVSADGLSDELRVNGAARIVIKDLVADNGVLHVIDQILVPDEGQSSFYTSESPFHQYNVNVNYCALIKHISLDQSTSVSEPLAQ